MSKNRITICSRFRETKQKLLQVERIANEFEILEVEPPLTAQIVNETDYLIADFPHAVPILFEKPGRLKYIQGTWAGINTITTNLDLSLKKPTIPMTRLSNPTFSQFMAEVAISAVIGIERNHKLMRTSQDNKEWNRERLKSLGYRPLNELRIGILGLGEIGQKCAQLFKGLGCTVIGLVNRPRNGDHTVDRYYARGELPEMLSSCDYIINILPSTKETDNILSNDAFSVCKNAGFINIGRGNVCSEQDIIRGLDAGWLSEAFLDVFPVEPLPPQSPLWTHPKVTVSPHVAGIPRANEIADCFIANLTKVENGEDPSNCIDWDKLY